MKKILILDNSAVYLYNFRFEIIEGLINKGNRVYYTAPDSSNDEKVRLLNKAGASLVQIPIKRRSTNPIGELKLMSNYKRCIKKINPDCILTFTVKPNIYGNLIASKCGIPVMSNVTGLGSSLQEGRLKKIMMLLYKKALRNTARVFFENKSNLEFFTENKIIDSDRIRLLPGAGVNLKKFTPEEKKNNDGKLKFLFIGRIMREKGIEEFLEAAHYITATHLNTEFQILGPFEESAYKAIIESTINAQIKYLGYSTDVRAQIKEVDCIINPSYHEGMSNVLLEGAAMGKPLIASNIPGCREIIEHGNGYLFQVKSSKDLIEKILAFINLDQQDRDAMGVASRNKAVRNFDRKIVVNEYLEAINLLLGHVSNEAT